MPITYNIYVDDKIIHTSNDPDKAHQFVRRKFKEIIEYLEFEPLGDGQVEIWKNGFNNIKIVRENSDDIDILNLIKNHTSKDLKKVRFVETNVDVLTPCTPKRTRLKTTKTIEKASEGKIKKGNDGKMWISKKLSDGSYKWTRYYEKTHTLKNTKRKCPIEPAKNFSENTTKPGLDGNFWIVKKLDNGTKKWFRK